MKIVFFIARNLGLLMTLLMPTHQITMTDYMFVLHVKDVTLDKITLGVLQLFLLCWNHS